MTTHIRSDRGQLAETMRESFDGQVRTVLTALSDPSPAVPDERSLAPAITSGPDGDSMLLVSVNRTTVPACTP